MKEGEMERGKAGEKKRERRPRVASTLRLSAV